MSSSIAGPELTPIVCWTRMQSEAGQSLLEIFARKELERHHGEGVFFWGVGNAPGLTAAVLAKSRTPVDVVFSVMKGRPKARDVSPSRIVVWRKYLDLHGAARSIPDHVLVCSRADEASTSRRGHYALVCFSKAPLALGDFGIFDPQAFRNFSGNGAPVAASQVTALLRRVAPMGGVSDYRINFAARLAQSYWVKLGDPTGLSAKSKRLLGRLTSQAGRAQWRDLVSACRSGDPLSEEGQGMLPL